MKRRRWKNLAATILAAALTALIIATMLALPYAMAATAAGSAPGPVPWSSPAGGAGRQQITGKLESRKIILAPQGKAASEVESEAVSEEKQQVTVNESAEDIIVPSTADYANGTDVGRTEALIEVIPERDDPPASELDVLIRETAERYDLPWQLVKAVCWAESRYNPNAKSDTPDYGIMQITSGVLGEYGLHDPESEEEDGLPSPYDVSACLDAGCRILREKLDLSGGDFTAALMRYNEGDDGARLRWAAGEFSTKYSNDVLEKYYEILREGK